MLLRHGRASTSPWPPLLRYSSNALLTSYLLPTYSPNYRARLALPAPRGSYPVIDSYSALPSSRLPAICLVSVPAL